MLCGSLDGKRVWGRMDMCIYMTESLNCLPKTHNIVNQLYFNTKLSFFFFKQKTGQGKVGKRKGILCRESSEQWTERNRDWGGTVTILAHLKKIFILIVADLQCCIKFSYTAQWLCYTKTSIYTFFLNLFPYSILLDIEYSSLCYIVGLCYLFILYIVVSLDNPNSQSSPPQHPSSWQPHVLAL